VWIADRVRYQLQAIRDDLRVLDVVGRRVDRPGDDQPAGRRRVFLQRLPA
jgi:hypothetical protein